MPGDWISASMTPTLRPMAANKVAILAIVLDFPVPPRKEWIEMMIGAKFLPP